MLLNTAINLTYTLTTVSMIYRTKMLNKINTLYASMHTGILANV